MDNNKQFALSLGTYSFGQQCGTKIFFSRGKFTIPLRPSTVQSVFCFVRLIIKLLLNQRSWSFVFDTTVTEFSYCREEDGAITCY